MPKAAVARAKELPVPARAPLSPFGLMRSLSEEMDRVFSDFGLKRRWPFSTFAPEGEEALWSPDLEIEQRDNKLVVRADLPGLTKSDVKVEVADDVLTIEGERKHEAEKKGDGYYRSECSYGHFYRSLALPEGAKADTAKATFKDGVLEITLDAPTPSTTPTRQVAIE